MIVQQADDAFVRFLPQPLDHRRQPEGQVGIHGRSSPLGLLGQSTRPEPAGPLQAHLSQRDQTGEVQHLDRRDPLGILGSGACAQGLGDGGLRFWVDECVHKHLRLAVVEP
jgi:hypothetical protein